MWKWEAQHPMDHRSNPRSAYPSKSGSGARRETDTPLCQHGPSQAKCATDMNAETHWGRVTPHGSTVQGWGCSTFRRAMRIDWGATRGCGPGPPAFPRPPPSLRLLCPPMPLASACRLASLAAPVPTSPALLAAPRLPWSTASPSLHILALPSPSADGRGRAPARSPY